MGCAESARVNLSMLPVLVTCTASSPVLPRSTFSVYDDLKLLVTTFGSRRPSLPRLSCRGRKPAP